MSKVIMHIGVHGLFPGILRLAQSAAKAELQQAGILPISAAVYRQQLRAAVTDGDGTQSHPAIVGARNSSLVTGLKASRTYVLSNDRLMSGDSRISKRGEIYPEAKRRVSNLRAIFADHDIHIKLFLCEFPVFAAANALPVDSGSAEANWPWTGLVIRVMEGAGDSELSVFGVRPTETLKSLLPSAFLGETTALGARLGKVFSAECEMTASALGGIKGKSPTDIADDHFRMELKAISRLPSVSVYEA